MLSASVRGEQAEEGSWAAAATKAPDTGGSGAGVVFRDVPSEARRKGLGAHSDLIEGGLHAGTWAWQLPSAKGHSLRGTRL